MRERPSEASEPRLELEAVEIGSVRARMRQRGGTSLVSQMAAVVSLLTFIGATPAVVEQALDTRKPDGTQCAVTLTAKDLSPEERERILRAVGELPPGCGVKIALEAEDGTRASVTYKTSDPPGGRDRT